MSSGSISLTPQEAAQELLRRQRMRESLIGFASEIDIPGVAVKPEDEEDDDVVDPIFRPVSTGLASHHILLLNKLQETMSRPYGRLMVFMPPGSAKSTYATVVAPTWIMAKIPEYRIILGSYNIELAKKQGAKARNICQQEKYQGAFNTEIDRTTNAKHLWKLGNKSEYMSAGLNSGVTGNRANGVVIDDPIRGRADAESDTIRDTIWGAWRDDVQTRLLPGGWVIWIQTRWHYDDPAGRLLPENYDGESGVIKCRDGMDWEVLNIVAKIENEKQERNDPLGRKVGEYLWPEWFDKTYWKQYEPVPGDPDSPSLKSWASLFQQNPKPDTGNQWDEDFTTWYEIGKHPKYLNLFAASDYALSTEEDGDDPDYTEHGIAGLDENGDIWLIDWWWGQDTPDVTIDAFVRLCKKWGVRQGFGEKGLIQKAIEPQFQHKKRQLKHQISMKYLPTITKKEARFWSFRALGASGKVHIPDCPWGRRLHEQLCAFPQKRRGYHDDGVDVCSLFGRGLQNMKWSRAKVPTKRKSGVVFGSWEWLTMGSEETEEHPEAFS